LRYKSKVGNVVYALMHQWYLWLISWSTQCCPG